MTTTLTFGQKQLFHPNPVNSEHVSVSMPSDYNAVSSNTSILVFATGFDTSHFIDIIPLAVGIANITVTASKPDGTLVTEVITVNTIAPPPTGFDHFEPVFDPPRFV